MMPILLLAASVFLNGVKHRWRARAELREVPGRAHRRQGNLHLDCPGYQ